MNEKKIKAMLIALMVLCVMWLVEVCFVTVELNKAKKVNADSIALLEQVEETLDLAKRLKKDGIVLSNAAQEVLKDAY